MGFKLDRHFASGDAILHSLAPLLDRWVDGEKQLFKMDRHESFAVEFTTDDGFQYGIGASNIHVTFTHRMRARPVSGGPPVIEMLSSPRPFTELLPTASERLLNATLLIPGSKDRSLLRVGVVSSTAVAEDEVPPGIARFIKYVGRPWSGLTDSFSFQITTEIAQASGWSDRCIHNLTKPEDPEKLLTIIFDWQRTYASGRPIKREVLAEILSVAEKDSQKYFEELAEGSIFDEEIISRTA